MENTAPQSSLGGNILYLSLGVIGGITFLLLLATLYSYLNQNPSKNTKQKHRLEKLMAKLKKSSKTDSETDSSDESVKRKKKQGKKKPIIKQTRKVSFKEPEVEEVRKPKGRKDKSTVRPGNQELRKARTPSFFERQGTRKFPIIRICFTGGPCSGKTTALAHCAQQLRQLGIKTFIVPEAEAVLNNGGAVLSTSGKSDVEKLVKYQINLLRTQMALEDTLADVGGDFYPDDKVVILCDKGTMDASVRLDRRVWQVLLDETGWTNVQLRDKRYDLVLHLVTAADGAEEYFKLENGECRTEDLEDALKVDRRTQRVWVGHPSFCIAGFDNKMQRCLDIIYLFMRLPLATTFYKNLKDGVLTMPNIEVFDVEDTYLVANAPVIEEKVSRRGQTDCCSYMHSQKYRGEKTGIIEKKRQISAREYMKLLETANDSMRVLKKCRQCFLYNKSYMVIDTYTNVDGCPSILRVLQEKDSKDVLIPSNLGVVRVITDEKTYDNYAMANPKWEMPEEDKKKIDAVDK